MSIKIFCDLCLEDMSEERENLAVVSLFSKEYSFLKKNVQPRIKEEKLQLCSKCSKKLREFLDSKRSESKK